MHFQYPAAGHYAEMVSASLHHLSCECVMNWLFERRAAAPDRETVIVGEGKGAGVRPAHGTYQTVDVNCASAPVDQAIFARPLRRVGSIARVLRLSWCVIIRDPGE